MDQSHTKSRSRDEYRTVSVFRPVAALVDTLWQPHLATAIQVERQVFTGDTTTGLLRRGGEAAFYVRNTIVAIKPVATAIRANWESKPRRTVLDT